jgi:hypothetical protein
MLTSTSSFYVPLVGFPLLSNSAISNYDEYRDHAILSFGGSSINGTTADSNLYMIDPISYSWKILTSSSSISPPPRKGACLLNIKRPLKSAPEYLLMDPSSEGTILLMYGDSKDVDGYTITHNDAWLGRIAINGNSVSWERLSFQSPKRTGQSCLYIEHPRKLFVYGGANENGTDIESISQISLNDFGLNDVILPVEEIQGLSLPPIDDPITINAEESTLVLTSGTDLSSSGYYALDVCEEPKWTFTSSYQPYDSSCQGEIQADYTSIIIYGAVSGVLLLTLLW